MMMSVETTMTIIKDRLQAELDSYRAAGCQRKTDGWNAI